MTLASFVASFRPTALVAALLMAGCASDPVPVAGAEADRAPGTGSRAQRQGDELSRRFPPARADLRIEPDEHGLPLAALVEQLTACTGVVYSYDASTGVELGRTEVQLSAPVTIAARDVYPWAEALLLQHGFEIGAGADAVPPLATLQSRRPGSSSVPVSPLYVPPERTAFLREHPALRVTTTLHVPNVDVRTLGNSLRALTGNDQGAVLMPVANTQSVVITGAGAQVAQLVDLLATVADHVAADLGLGTDAAIDKARAATRPLR